MAISNSTCCWLLAIAAAASLAGCATGRRSNGDCADCCDTCPVKRAAVATYKGELADDKLCCSKCFGEGCGLCDRLVRPVTCGPECANCRGCSLIPFGLGDHWFTKPTPGPPPQTLRTPMPPKLLPVPTEPTLSPVRPDAPEPQRGNVEMGWRPQMTIPGHD